jgi:hypothetical protein
MTSALARTNVLDRRWLDLDGGFGRAQLVQEELVREFSHADVYVASHIGRRLASIEAGASVWLRGAALQSFGGHMGVSHSRPGGGASWSARVSRAPIWRSPRGTDPLKGLRVRDLTRLDGGLTATDLRLSGAVGRVRLEGGTTRYGDGNRRLFAHGRLELPLWSSGSSSISVEPAVYSETFSGSTMGFLTYESLASLAVGLRIARTGQSVSVEAALEPHLFRYPSGVVAGIGGHVTSSVPVGRARLAFAAEFLQQSPHGFLQVVWSLSLPTG